VVFEPEIELAPRDALRQLQGKRLRELVARVADRVPMYRDRLAEAGVRAADIATVDDVTKLPITRKSDLRDHYPFGLLAVPRRELRRVHASSGTTGKATVVAYTAEDLDLFARVNARALAMGGAEPGMMLHNAYGYGLFTGGLGLHYGGERLGLAVVPVSGGMTDRQVTLIRDFEPEVICCTPSYALTLATEFRKRGVEPSAISLRFALLGAEPWTDAMRVQIDAGLGVRSTNIYGLSEIIGPGVSNECVEARDGSHISEDHFLPEILDPESGEPVPEGHEGVLVITTLTKQALPLVRYWTGDITSLTTERCACGRTLARMRLIKGRTDDMLIIRGVNVYPSQVESVIARIPELAPHYRIVVSREHLLDEIEVHAEISEQWVMQVGVGHIADDDAAIPESVRALRDKVAGLLRETIGVGMHVRLVRPGEAPRSEGGKLTRVVDRRPRG
jgi:phenylacetate-CoA ligase